jgi:hypothetical protein
VTQKELTQYLFSIEYLAERNSRAPGRLAELRPPRETVKRFYGGTMEI